MPHARKPVHRSTRPWRADTRALSSRRKCPSLLPPIARAQHRYFDGPGRSDWGVHGHESWLRADYALDHQWRHGAGRLRWKLLRWLVIERNERRTGRGRVERASV